MVKKFEISNNIRKLRFPAIFFVEIAYTGYSALVVNQNFTDQGMRSQFTITGRQSDGDHCIMCSAFCIHRAGISIAIAHADTGRASAIGNRITHGRYGEGVKFQSAGRCIEQ